MRYLVTGSAGFIGRHVCSALLSGGHEVVGLDCYTEYYDPVRKRANTASFSAAPTNGGAVVWSACRDGVGFPRSPYAISARGSCGPPSAVSTRPRYATDSRTP